VRPESGNDLRCAKQPKKESLERLPDLTKLAQSRRKRRQSEVTRAHGPQSDWAAGELKYRVVCRSDRG